MTQLTYLAVSGYRIQIENVLRALCEEGRGDITQDELLMVLQRRPTQNFRKHMSEMQRDGIVLRFTYQTDRGGYKVAYQICQSWTK